MSKKTPPSLDEAPCLGKISLEELNQLSSDERFKRIQAEVRKVIEELKRRRKDTGE